MLHKSMTVLLIIMIITIIIIIIMQNLYHRLYHLHTIHRNNFMIVDRNKFNGIVIQQQQSLLLILPQPIAKLAMIRFHNNEKYDDGSIFLGRQNRIQIRYEFGEYCQTMVFDWVCVFKLMDVLQPQLWTNNHTITIIQLPTPVYWYVPFRCTVCHTYWYC